MLIFHNMKIKLYILSYLSKEKDAFMSINSTDILYMRICFFGDVGFRRQALQKEKVSARLFFVRRVWLAETCGKSNTTLTTSAATIVYVAIFIHSSTIGIFGLLPLPIRSLLTPWQRCRIIFGKIRREKCHHNGKGGDLCRAHVFTSGFRCSGMLFLLYHTCPQIATFSAGKFYFLSRNITF